MEPRCEGGGFLHNSVDHQYDRHVRFSEHAPVKGGFFVAKNSNQRAKKLEEVKMRAEEAEELRRQEEEFCQRMSEQVVDPVNIYFAAINLSVDPQSHEYKDAILIGWFCLHGGLHNLLKEFPLLKDHYGKIGLIPLHPEAYGLLQLFITWRHCGDINYVTRRMDWFRRRFTQIQTGKQDLFFHC